MSFFVMLMCIGVGFVKMNGLNFYVSFGLGFGSRLKIVDLYNYV